MSLTSYRAAPPRVICVSGPRREFIADEIRGRGGVRRGVIRGGGSLRPAALPSQCVGLREPGGDLLFRVLRRSTIGAEGFHGRVRDGIGCFAPRYGHQAGQPRFQESGTRSQAPGTRWSRAGRAGRKRVGFVSSGRGLPPRGPRLEFIPDMIRGRGTRCD